MEDKKDNVNINSNIEERIKKIFSGETNKNIKFDKEKMEIIEKLLTVIPITEPQKKIILDGIIGLDDKNEKNNKTVDYSKFNIVLDEFEYNNIIYYRDKAGGIWNENCELVGSYKNTGDTIKYYFFN